MSSNNSDADFKSTLYFQTVVTVKHPEVQRQWIKFAINNSVKRIVQSDGRIVLWGNIADAGNRALRVVLLEDGQTVHNAFFDRNFLKRQQRGTEPT